jgi:hypothetical protein
MLNIPQIIADQIYAAEVESVTMSSRVTQDRRKYMRVIARLDCQFTFNGASYEGVVVDISLKGALLSAKFLPPVNSEITVTFRPPNLSEAFILKSRVLRGNWAMSDHGRVGRFVIVFIDPPLSLIKLINHLLSPHHSP